jgi:ATP-dependent RNA helicase RhlE
VRALADFKDNKVVALVATEVAARGLDIKELPHVVNYELPNVPEDYVHRIGRTARAGGTGSAVSLVSPDETSLLRDIERVLRRSIPVAALPAYPVIAAPPGSAAAAADRADRPFRQGGGGRHDSQRQHASRPSQPGGHHPRHGRPSSGGGNSQDRGRPSGQRRTGSY